MIQIIYGDVLLLIDFCMNYFILYTSGILLRRRVKAICIAGAALVGGIYSVAKLFINGNDIFDFFITLAVGLLMCYITFGGYKFIKTALIFFGTSAMVGGIMFSIFYLLGSYHFDLFGNMRGYAYTHIPLGLFALLAGISLAISWIFSHFGRESVEKKEIYATVCRNGKCKKLFLLLDTGNLVKETISGKYVLLLSFKKADELLTSDEHEAVLKRKTEHLLKKGFRLVYAKGVGDIRKTYYAFLPDKIFFGEKEEFGCGDAYIAVCDDTDAFDGKDGIVNPAIIS